MPINSEQFIFDMYINKIKELLNLGFIKEDILFNELTILGKKIDPYYISNIKIVLGIMDSGIRIVEIEGQKLIGYKNI